MWPLCDFSLASALWLLGPLLLGLLTAWWIWGGRRDDTVAEAYAEPVRTLPEAEIIEPQAFTAPVVAPEPIPMAPPAAAAPVAAAAAMTAIGIAAAVGDLDDLLQIKGIGPKLNDLLISLGIRRFDQIAAWTSGDVAKVDQHLGTFTGRIERDQWIEQAGLLARGAIAEFEAKFGKLDSEKK